MGVKRALQKRIGSTEVKNYENVGSMDEMIGYYQIKGDMDKVNKIKRYKKEIYGNVGYIDTLNLKKIKQYYGQDGQIQNGQP